MTFVKRLWLVAALVLGLTSSAGATVYSWTPNPSDMWDLDHYEYYTWGITGTQATNLYNQLNSGDYEITGAKLTFTNIWDWIEEPDDHLYVELLDNPRSGARRWWDNQGGGNAFAGQGAFVGDWNDPYGGSPRNFDLEFDLVGLGLADILTSYILNNNSRSYFGFGFDPDCHYWNDGINLEITTSLIPEDPVVPEPATLALLGLGLSGLGVMRRKKA